MSSGILFKCMKASFYRADFQKLSMCWLIKRFGQAFQPSLSNTQRSFRLLKGEKLNPVFENLHSMFVITRLMLSQPATV